MMLKTWSLLCIMFAFLMAGCDALPVDVGVTVSRTPQFGLSGCILGAEPIVVGQANPDARCYGYARGYVLLGCSTRSAYAKSAGVT